MAIDWFPYFHESMMRVGYPNLEVFTEGTVPSVVQDLSRQRYVGFQNMLDHRVYSEIHRAKLDGKHNMEISLRRYVAQLFKSEEGEDLFHAMYFLSLQDRESPKDFAEEKIVGDTAIPARVSRVESNGRVIFVQESSNNRLRRSGKIDILPAKEAIDKYTKLLKNELEN